MFKDGLNNNDALYASTTDAQLPTHASTQVPKYSTNILIKIIKNKNKKVSEMTKN